MDLSWAARGSTHSHIWLCFPFLNEGKSRALIALNYIFGTMMSAPGTHLIVDLEGSAWPAKVHLPSLWRRGEKCRFLGSLDSGSSCAWKKHTVLIW